MPFVIPSFIQLRRDALGRGTGLAMLVARALGVAGSHAVHAASAFAFKNDELEFARELLARKTELWLFRTNQRAFCGDFVVVDVSSPARARRRAFVLDLKQGAPLRAGGGGAGVQLRNAPRVVRDVARVTGALDAEAPFELLTGDSGRILAFFGARAP